jgi:hypothetical protein
MAHVLVTLVHGTFSPAAAWVRSGSFFRNETTRLLGDQVDFEVFRWSGRNSHGARVRAGAALRQQLLLALQRHPSSRHIVIAHSHGGNVARYALRDPSLRRRVAGLVCLATPFVICDPREDCGLAGLLIVLLCGLPFLLYAGALAVVFRSEIDSPIQYAAVALLFLMLGFFVVARMIGLERTLAPLGPVFRAVANWNDRRLARLLERLSVARLSIPTLCVRASGDEASWALERVDRSTERPFQAVEHVLIGCGGGIVGAGYVGLAAAHARQWFGATWIEWVMMASLGAICVCVVAGLAWAFVMLTVPIVRVPLLGWEAPFDVWRCRIRVETVADGAHVEEKVYDVAPADGTRRRFALRLRHCAVYNDPAVIADVVAWMRVHGGMRPRFTQGTAEPRRP